jgi:hypothetical protein
MPDATYEGWKNRATWNVWLWLTNDEGLYFGMCDYIKDRAGERISYTGLINYLGLTDDSTPDGYKFLSTRISLRELNDAVNEHAQELSDHPVSR